MKYLFKTDENNVILTYQTCDWLDEAVECDNIDEVIFNKTILTIEDGKAILDNSGDYTEKGKRLINEAKIAKLKKKLADTDYQAIKHSEGLISDADYEAIKAERQAWRDEINELEKE